MGSAIGGNNSSTPPNEFWINVLDFGAGTNFTFDNTPVFQAAVDALAARLSAATTANPASRIQGTIFVPQSTNAYYFSAPVWVDSPFIEIRGEGEGTVLAMHYAVCHPIFIFGLCRVVGVSPRITAPLVADASYRPDLFGILDSTAASASGQRWGFQSNGNALIQAQGSPLDCGGIGSFGTADNWAESTSLTIDLAIAGPTGSGIPAGIPIAGIGVSTKSLLYPFTVYTDEVNEFVVLFCTQSQPHGPLTTHRFSFTSGSSVGLQRISMQIDLNAGVVAAFVNGVQVSVNNYYLGTGFGHGVFFAENDYYPLLIGNAGGDRPALGTISGFFFSLYGFSLSRSVRYLNAGVGQPQQRADNPTTLITDLYRYFTPRFSPTSEIDAGTIGYLAFTDPPGGRHFTIEGGNASGYSFGSAFLLHSLQILPAGIASNGLHNLQLIGGGNYGQNVAICQVLDLKITKLRSSSAYHAIGALSIGANYIVRVEECFLSGADSGYFALNQILWARNITFTTAGRATMRFVGCDVTMENVMVEFATTNSQSTIKIHAGDYGGNYSFNNIIVDYEGDSYSDAAIYCENHPYSSSTSLRLEDIYLGTIGNVPLLRLKEIDPSYPNATLIVDNLQTYTNQFLAVLDVDGPSWHGEVKNIAVGQAPRIQFQPNFGTACNLVIKESSYQAPPRSHLWYSGAHLLEVPSPALGQYTQWRCLVTGEYGTSSPPSWTGLVPINCGSVTVAGYILNHCFITVALS